MTLIRCRYSALTLLLAAGLQLGCGSSVSEEASRISPHVSKNSADFAGQPASDSVPVIPWLSNSQKKNFAILGASPEQLPQSVRVTLRHPTYGANWRLAQRLSTGDQNIRVWMLPAHESVCLVEQQEGEGAIGVTCTSIAQALKYGVVTSSFTEGTSISPAHRFIVGVAPDGVPRVRIKTPGFGSTAVRVTQNTFVLRDSVREPPESVELLRGR
jgi:hypothetical protein